MERKTDAIGKENKVNRALKIELNRIDKTTEIVLGYLTYHAGRLWNQANYLIKTGEAKAYFQRSI